MAKRQPDSNWDKAGVRERWEYQFWTPEVFAANHAISIRQLRNLMADGLPFHGSPHRGVPGSGLRLGVAAVQWMREYRRVTARGHFRGTRALMVRDELEAQHLDDRQAYARLYGATIPQDEYLESPDGSADKRSWRTKFREMKRSK